MQPGGRALSRAYLDRLADAIVSLEYYIETLQAGRSDPWYMLDNAQACLEVLGARAGAGRADRARRSAPPTTRARCASLRRRPTTLPGAQLDPDSTGASVTPPVLAAAAPAADTRCGRRSGNAGAVRRGGARGTGEDPRAVSGLGPEPARGRRAAGSCAARSIRSRAAGAWSARANSANSPGRWKT